MSSALMSLLILLLSLVAAPADDAGSPAASGLDPAAQVAESDGAVLLHYATRPGVRGNASTMRIELGGDGARTMVHGHVPHDGVLSEGPAYLLCVVEGGVVRSLDLRVGQAGDFTRRADRDLGEADPRLAAAWLLRSARVLPVDAAEDALTAAVIARDADIGPDLLTLAEDRALHADVRGHALIWTAHLAADKLAAAEMTRRAGAMIDDDREDLEVREAAVVALAQSGDERATERLLVVARGHAHPDLRRTALIMLSRRRDDPRVIALLEEIITAP
jgi:hypothetical protein